ncbi:hypothetical protein P280DRAFT_473827 [Massarina eburnea CBS 473.64]|uniref:Uncharacterized protein n=1 Tax=Massarina eburnea CBS 473.64 TaxID=1395130 RepID=A0A6A6RK40_9PLEO|nr:hypothetical protein P280DRAFT_473827 [Massarina eburnea CBS 473.64]
MAGPGIPKRHQDTPPYPHGFAVYGHSEHTPTNRANTPPQLPDRSMPIFLTLAAEPANP